MGADPTIRRAAVLGSPIAHSLSPLLHTAGYAAAGLSDWSYDAVEVVESGLAGFVEALDASWRGLSLTMPLKEVAFAVATDVSEVARRAQAINTLVRRADGGWDADNTDVHGMVASLRDVEHSGRARVIGAGATARSAVLALRELGVRHVEVAARRVEAAESLTAFAREQGMPGRTVPLAEWALVPPPLVVSTVPAAAGQGLVATLPASPEQLDVTLFDVVYAPWPSPLATGVEARGGVAISGLEMLIHQAARQFELFTGLPGDVAAMRAAVRDRP
ncbi:MAG: shikimate dehydrogenase [Dermatophilaceae bacterium]